MPRFYTDVFVYDDDRFVQGHKPGTLRVGQLVIGFTGAVIPQLEQLRDECQRQIGEILNARRPVQVGQTLGPLEVASLEPVTEKVREPELLPCDERRAI